MCYLIGNSRPSLAFPCGGAVGMLYVCTFEYMKITGEKNDQHQYQRFHAQYHSQGLNR
ncbi:hypothetical protein PHAMO_120015 [Magnetospirillum molischianum DSM 120]|uniref:Uncharacterized protein n=1 Tax=Magnetospirillum molischianum DSM 120 TaxID=1150626 RepID=H8FNI2_MAGML|nr:hypothetical protein PHAMO_120003 [Magnetospirillum molischianum DSM 120]CCG39920.1 hypothetical protein PHAMO_120009 [Magnetospirillum molischianum DSM 120]CCG39926.1 hypothetical protein PHAMO_120015 [Magnetospirillum molischianum DSM 120]